MLTNCQSASYRALKTCLIQSKIVQTGRLVNEDGDNWIQPAEPMSYGIMRSTVGTAVVVIGGTPVLNEFRQSLTRGEDGDPFNPNSNPWTTMQATGSIQLTTVVVPSGSQLQAFGVTEDGTYEITASLGRYTRTGDVQTAFRLVFNGQAPDFDGTVPIEEAALISMPTAFDSRTIVLHTIRELQAGDTVAVAEATAGGVGLVFLREWGSSFTIKKII